MSSDPRDDLWSRHLPSDQERRELVGVVSRIYQDRGEEDNGSLEDSHQNPEPVTLHDLCPHVSSHGNAKSIGEPAQQHAIEIP